MASADLAGMVKLWQANAGARWACTRTIPIDRPIVDNRDWGYRSIQAALTSDGKSLVTYSSPQPAVALWNLGDGARTGTFALPGPGKLNSLALSPDGKLLAAAHTTQQGHGLLLWDVAKRALHHNIASDVGSIYDVAFSSNGNYLGYAGEDGGVVLEGSKFQRLHLVRAAAFVSVHFSPDDKQVAFAYPGGAVRLWEMADERGAR